MKMTNPSNTNDISENNRFFPPRKRINLVEKNADFSLGTRSPNPFSLSNGPPRRTEIILIYILSWKLDFSNRLLFF